MGHSESKHDKVLNRVHLWVAILGGIITVLIGAYNFRNMFFSDKSAGKPAMEMSAESGPGPKGTTTLSTVSVQNESLSFETFLPMDQNGDGKILESEWRGTREDFYRLNLDGNNALTAQDFKGVRFEDMDRNADGEITRTEWRKVRSSFDLLDEDGDGKISADEFSARWKAAGP